MSMNVYLTGKDKATGLNLTDRSGNDAGNLVAEVTPPIITGITSAKGEVGAFTGTPVVKYFPSGLKAMTVSLRDLGSTTATEAYFAFNNTIFSDVAIDGLREEIALGETKTFMFTVEQAVTSVTMTTNVASDIGSSKIFHKEASYE